MAKQYLLLRNQSFFLPLESNTVMLDPFFYTEFLVALRDLDNFAYSQTYQTLKEELSADAISEAQFATLPSSFAALIWTCMKGRILHVSSMDVALAPHGLYLTVTAEVLVDVARQTFEHVPISLLPSPALLAQT